VISPAQRRLALLVAGCFFMENLDVTIVTTAAPRIGASLHVASTSVGLLVTVYLLTLAVLIPLSGWLTRRLGERPVFLTAIVVFTAASLGCTVSNSLGELVGMRVLQGIGGAMMVPVGRLVVLRGTAKSDVMRMTTFVVMPGLVAPVVAPLIGGLITTYASWRWLFAVNLPLGLIAVVVAFRIVPPHREGGAAPLDVVGVLLTCTGLGGLAETAHLLSATSTRWALVAGAAVPTVVLLTAARRHLLRTPHPLIDLRIMRITTLRVAVVAGASYWLVVGAGPFLLPLLFQTVFGWSPLKSGAVVLFIFVGNVGVEPAIAPLLRRFGYPRVLAGATLGMAATMLAAAAFTAGTPLGVIIVVALASGVARSIALTAFNTISISDVSPEQLRVATTLTATTQQTSSGLGVAFSTVALRVGQPVGRWLPGSPGPGTAYTVAFVLLAVVAVLTMLETRRLPPDAGHAVGGAVTGGEPATG
jgi:EmrB/QacA subfamily drug resistance transporter